MQWQKFCYLLQHAFQFQRMTDCEQSLNNIVLSAFSEENLDGRSANISYLEISLKPAVFYCLTNGIVALLPTALESCSNPQMILPSLLVCTWKKFFGWGLRFFCEWRDKWSSFWAILAHVIGPAAQPLGQSISLKFLLETRLESESFDLLFDFLAFLVQSYDLK